VLPISRLVQCLDGITPIREMMAATRENTLDCGMGEGPTIPRALDKGENPARAEILKKRKPYS
jgi:hypothetical protein